MKRIYEHLKGMETDENLNPYFIGQHQGECEKEFAVIRKGTQLSSIMNNKTGQQIVDIILFVPARSFIEMETYATKIRTALKELNYLRKTGLETPVIAEDEKKAYSMSIEYVLQKKLEG